MKNITKSHPSRVRGLKSVKAIDYVEIDEVAPFTGAWIEIEKRGEKNGH